MSKLLTERDYVLAADVLNVEVAAIKAVAHIESAGDGFDRHDRPKILFERHIFSRLTNRRFNKQHPLIANTSPGGYSGDQHRRLGVAIQLDRNAALQSASWGKFQVLGTNAASLGYPSIQSFVDRMWRHERDHLDAFVRFIERNNLARSIRTKDWTSFARGYNGPNFRQNAYHTKMDQAYRRFKAQNQDTLLLQSDLTELGFNPGPIDGLLGPRTKSALVAFQAHREIPQTGLHDNTTKQHLNAIQALNRADFHA